MPQFDPYTSSSIASDHKNKVENAVTTKPPPPATLQKPAAQPEQLSECDMCACCTAHNTQSHSQRPPTCTSPTSACCGTSCPDLDTDADSPLHSPATFHQRHAHLRLQQQQEPLISSSGESFSGTRPSAAEQSRDARELQRSQQEDDSIRMILASERARAEGVGGVDGDEPVPGEFSKEIKMLNGGWMERGKLC